MRSLARAWIALSIIVVLAGCGDKSGGGGPVSERTLEMSYSVVQALDDYAFTSDLQLSSAGRDLNATFDGVFQAPDRFQGTFDSSGTFQIGQPSHAELTAIGEQVWLKGGDGQWQPADPPALGPLLTFLNNATPSVFVNGLTFDSLRLTTSGRDTINGIDVHHVQLDKDALVGTLDQGLFTKEEDKDPAIVREDALAFLPDDTFIDVWLATDDLHPVRIVISLSAAEDDEHARDFLEKPLSIRLQMDITDPDTDVEIAPPDGGDQPVPTP